MKIVQAAVLVFVGALAAMLFVKMRGGPETDSPVTQAVALPEAQPLAAPERAEEAPTAPESAAPAPARRVKKHARVLTSSLRNNQPSSNPIDIQPAQQPQAPGSIPRSIAEVSTPRNRTNIPAATPAKSRV